MVLFESPRTIAFPGHARGDRVSMGLRPESWTNHPADPPLDRYVPNTPTTSGEVIVLPAKRSERLCRPIQFLGIERFSFLPDSQCHGGDLARQCQPRHLFAHALLL